ncbi:YqgE/AlgH family protein [Compostibacter hankyongensis]|uniref:UPF0301 protein GCM10023143_32480 n=1 Tax=Compostibacter hankyongensis TaxID=1007089 RepID=A0ABP8G8P1_9BACT
METPAAGRLLIADPFLKDPNFARTVILLCEHRDEGSLGFVINRPSAYTLDACAPGTVPEGIPVYTGGPVSQDTLHFIHRFPGLLEGGLEILPGVFWGGDFERLTELLELGLIDVAGLRFFSGYAGWSEGQLEKELQEHTWIVSEGAPELVFLREAGRIWQQSLRDLGGEYAPMAGYPVDPSLN